MKAHVLVLTMAAMTGASVLWAAEGEERVALRVAAPPPATSTAPAPAEAAKPLTENVKKGVAWLVAHQNEDGGWAQGDESSGMGASGQMEQLKGKSNVADTCIAALALLRAGSTPKDGPHKDQLAKAVAFVCKEVEASDEKGLSVTSVNGTRVQSKLGGNIDTFLSSLLLGEVRNQMADDATRKRTVAALDKVLNKIEKNQKEDGGVAHGGWAPDLAQGLAARGTNVAARNGAAVSGEVLERFEKNARDRIGKDGKASVGGSSAGVSLYAQASNVDALQSADKTYDHKLKELKSQLDAPAATTSPTQRAQLEALREDLGKKREMNGTLLKTAQNAVAEQVNDDKFMAGFGSNGGEEFLSYLNLGESLQSKGGDDWTKWNGKMTANLSRVQNPDGSWSGDHCITGRTFCTASAVMVLTIDRAPAVAAKIAKR